MGGPLLMSRKWLAEPWNIKPSYCCCCRCRCRRCSHRRCRRCRHRRRHRRRLQMMFRSKFSRKMVPCEILRKVVYQRKKDYFSERQIFADLKWTFSFLPKKAFFVKIDGIHFFDGKCRSLLATNAHPSRWFAAEDEPQHRPLKLVKSLPHVSSELVFLWLCTI